MLHGTAGARKVRLTSILTRATLSCHAQCNACQAEVPEAVIRQRHHALNMHTDGLTELVGDLYKKFVGELGDRNATL